MKYGKLVREHNKEEFLQKLIDGVNGIEMSCNATLIELDPVKGKEIYDETKNPRILHTATTTTKATLENVSFEVKNIRPNVKLVRNYAQDRTPLETREFVLNIDDDTYYIRASKLRTFALAIRQKLKYNMKIKI